MTTVREILQQSGIDEYSINSLDERVTSALGNVLAKAELDRISVDDFWKNTYNPGVAAWESERQELAGKYARAQAEKAALLAERQALADSGIVGNDLPINVAQPRNSGGQFTTPGTPQFSGDPNEFIGKAAQGLAQLSDIEFKYRNLYNAPLPVLPSQIVAEADRLGVSPMEYANRQWKFADKEKQQYEDRIRTEERAKVAKEYGEKYGPNPDIAVPRGSSGFSDIQRAVKTGERKDPLKLDAAGRRQQALQAIHRAVEERQQRDA